MPGIHADPSGRENSVPLLRARTVLGPSIGHPILGCLVLLISQAVPSLAQTTPLRLTPEWEATHELRVYTSNDGLPQNSVNDILQTRDGYIWLATFGGVARFDGVQFETFDLATEPGLPGNRATALLETDNGAVWVGFQDGALARRAPGGRFVEVPVPEGLSPGTISELAQGPGGSIWISGDRTVLRFSAEEGFSYVSDGTFRGPILSTPRGVWTVIPGPHLARFDNDGGEEARIPLSRTARKLFLSRDSVLWVASDQDLSVHFPGQPRLVVGEGLASYDLAQDHHGRILVAGVDLVALEMEDPGDLDQILVAASRPILARTGSISGASIFTALLVDREGNIWAGSRGGGLVLIRRQSLRQHPLPPEFGPRELITLTPDGEGGIWAGGCGSGVFHYQEGVYRKEPGLQALDYSCPQDLLQDPQGRLWIALRREEGIYAYEKGRLRRFPAEGGGRLWIDDAGRVNHLAVEGWSRWNGQTLERFPAPEGVLQVGSATSLLRDGESRIWIGHGNGFTLWTPDSMRHFDATNGVPVGPVRALQLDGARRLWIGTYGAGIGVLVGDSVRSVTTAQGLADNFVSGILSDEEGNLWLNGNRVLSVLPARQARAFAEGRIHRVLPGALAGDDGFVEASGPNGFRDSQGHLWFGTLNGLLEVDPREVLEEPALPRPTVGTVLADQEALSGSDLEVPAGTRLIEITYTAPSFLHPEQIRFRYRLLGSDDSWVFAGSRRTAYFTDLDPGRYEFQVQASALSGDWAEAGASLPFAVLPTIWQTIWFRVGTLLLISGALIGAIYYRINDLKRHGLALQAQIDERERAELERDRVEAQLRRSEKLKAVGQLTGGVAHDFNNLLTVVMGNLELAQDTIREGEVREFLERAENAALRGSALTRQLLAFSRRQPLAPIPVDLRELLGGMGAILDRALGESVRVSLSYPEPPWTCLADRSQLENAVLNLAINARDAMPKGGTLTIETRNVTLSEGEAREIPEANPGQFVVLVVSDTGVGMKREVLDQIFDPFFTTKEEGRGSGLGLSTVYGFVRQTGGFVTAYSEEDQGTTFRLYLPRSDLTPSGEVESLDVPEGHGETILVVEDNPEVLEVTEKLLRELGYQPVGCSTAEGAMEFLKGALEPDLLLTDLILPGGMSGAGLVARARERNPGLSVLLMSGFPGVVQRELESMPEQLPILEKPFTGAELARKIQNALLLREES